MYYKHDLKYTYPEYEIKKTVEKGGTVTIDKTAMAGSIIHMRINPEPGYELKEIIVTDEKGNPLANETVIIWDTAYVKVTLPNKYASDNLSLIDLVSISILFNSLWKLANPEV